MQANCTSAEEQVDELSKAMAEAKASEEAFELGSALSKVTGMYKELYAQLKEANLPIPDDAVVASNSEIVWHEDSVLGAKDWTGFDNAGWTLVENLPGLPEAFCTAYFITTTQPKTTAAPVVQPSATSLPLSFV